jgi:hypothetical protein
MIGMKVRKKPSAAARSQRPSPAGDKPVMRKVTMLLPDELVRSAQASSQTSLTETVRTALKEILHRKACQQLLALRGKVDLGINWKELKTLRD